MTTAVELINVFKEYDEHATGLINIKMFKEMLMTIVRDSLTEDDLIELILRYGQIDYTAFIKMIMGPSMAPQSSQQGQTVADEGDKQVVSVRRRLEEVPTGSWEILSREQAQAQKLWENRCAVHIMGFASGLKFDDENGSARQAAVDNLMSVVAAMQPDFITFDGDNYHPESFSRIVPLVQSKVHPRPQLIAFVRNDGRKQKFMESWKDAQDLDGRPMQAGGFIVELDDDDVTKNGFFVNGQSYRGAYATFLLGTDKVVLLGGGGQCVHDFRRTRLGQDGFHDKQPTFTVLPVNRVTKAGLENCHLDLESDKFPKEFTAERCSLPYVRSNGGPNGLEVVR